MCASQRFHNKMSVQTSFSYPWELLFQNIICEHFNLGLTYLTTQPIWGSLSLMLGCHVIKANSSSLRLLPSLLTSQSLNYLSTTRSGQTMETSSFTLTIIVGLLDLEHYQLKWSCQKQVKGRASHSSRLRLMSVWRKEQIGKLPRNLRGSSKRKNSSGNLVNFPNILG